MELDVEYDRDKLKYEEKDMNKLIPLYKEMEFKRFLEDAERAKKNANPLQGTLFQTAVQEKAPVMKEAEKEYKKKPKKEVKNVSKLPVWFGKDQTKEEISEEEQKEMENLLKEFR